MTDRNQEAAQPPVLPGTRVVFTMNGLGLIRQDGTVNAGDYGTVLGPGPDAGWTLISPDRYPLSVCPCATGMFRPAP